MQNKANRVDFLRKGFTDSTFKGKAVKPTGDWIAMKAVHPSDLSSIEQAVEVDYSHCLVHEVMSCGPEVKGGEPGMWCIVIRNALDGLSAKKRFVVAKEEDVVFWIAPEKL